MTSVRQSKKETSKRIPPEFKKEIVTKRQQKQALTQHRTSVEKTARKIQKKEAAIKKQEQQIEQYVPQSKKEMNAQIAQFKEKHRENKPDVIPKTPKKAQKKLHDTTNGVAFNFAGNEGSSQTYAVHPLKNGGYVLQTNILGVPALSDTHTRDLRVAAGLETTRLRRNRINALLENALRPDNKTDSLSIEMGFDKDYNLKNIQVGAYIQMTDRHFHDKDFAQSHIDTPLIDETFTQFNNIMGFCKGYLATYRTENEFLDFLKDQEAIKKDYKAPEAPMTADEMVQALETLGYTYDFDEEITPIDFKTIQTNILKTPEEEVLPPYKPAQLSADYAVQILRCVTNEAITQHFNSENIPHFEYDINPKNDKPLTQYTKNGKTAKKSIAPITDPVTDPRATLNAVILRHFVENEEILFRKTQMGRVQKAMIEKNFKWEKPAIRDEKTDKLPNMKISPN